MVSIKAVDVQTAITGVRSYSELTDTASGYQVNDVIFLATTVEVRNLEKSAYRSLKSIEGEDISTFVGSDYVDLSYSKYTTPILLSHIYSGINDTAIGTFADVISVSNVLDYDKDKNEVEFVFHGYEQNAVSWLSGFSTSSYNNVYLSAYVLNEKVYIPALRAKDGKNTITLGSSTYTYSYDSPGSMAYTLVLTGVCKDNAGAEKGTYYAKIEVSGAEKFVDEGYYYVAKDGSRILSSQLATGGVYANYVEWVDYIRVDVKLLEIDNAYNVYKYEIPASAMLGTDVPVIYFGDDEDYDQKVLAKADPTRWDYSTGKTTKDGSTTLIGTTDINTAGGVTKQSAVFTYTYDSTAKAFVSTSKKDVPLTGVVYTELATVYAPAYFAGVIGGTANTTVKEVYGDVFTIASTSTTKDRTTVDKFVIENVIFDGDVRWGGMRNLDVTVLDANSGKLIKNNPSGTNTGAVYKTEWSAPVISGTTYTYTVTVTPVSGTVYPTGSSLGSTTAQQWEVYLGTPVSWGVVSTTEASATPGTIVPTAYDGLFDTLGNSAWTTQSTLSALATAVGTLTPGGANQPSEKAIYIAGNGVSSLPAAVAPVPETTPPGSNGVKGFDATASDLRGVATMSSPGTSGNFYTRANAGSIQFVEEISTKNVAATDTGIRITLREGWDDAQGKEQPSGAAFNAGLAGQTVKNVYVYWASSSELTRTWGRQAGALVEQFVAADGEVVIDGSDIIVYPGAIKQTAWDGTEGTDVSPAYVKASAADAGAVVADMATVAGSSVTLSGGGTIGSTTYTAPTTIISAGWAQSNGYNGPSNIPTVNSRTYRNAMVVVEFEVPSSTYTYNQAMGTVLYGYVPIVEDGDGHNGIDVYVVTFNSDDQPIVAIATEATYFESEDGLSIAMFDAYNQSMLGTRISRSSNTNMVYATGSGSVDNSSKIITAMQYFGLDTSWSTTYRITEDTFEAKGADAVYSEKVEGTFNYGTLTLVGEEVEEATTEEEVVDDDDTNDVVDDEVEDTNDVVDDDQTIPPTTGDSSVNIAIALAAAAIVAAAGLVFVMKKAR